MCIGIIDDFFFLVQRAYLPDIFYVKHRYAALNALVADSNIQ